jgi:aminoglycoside phosphotransferase (APT) family kinase protein
VLDWVAAGRGDPHEDIAWTAMLTHTFAAGESGSEREQSAREIYLRIMRAMCDIDTDALRYCEVWAALRWLILLLPALRDGTSSILDQRRAAATFGPQHLRRVVHFLEERIDTTVSLAIVGSDSTVLGASTPRAG